MLHSAPTVAFLLAALAATPRQAPSARVDALAREVTALFEKGDFEGVIARFSPQMGVALPEETFRQIWNSLHAQLGALNDLGAPVVRIEKGVECAWVQATFQKSSVFFRMTFDARGRLAGFRIFPGPPPDDGSPGPPPDPTGAREREVTVGSGEWALPGTLTLPVEGSGPFAALVLVHGWGPLDRDESVGGTKVFRDLAGGLAARGVAVLRYEKRTKVHGARMTGRSITVKEEVVDDALAAVALLRAQPEVDARRVALLGHSLGGMLGPQIAAGEPALAGLAVLAGNTRPLDVLAPEQIDRLVSAGSATPEQATAMKEAMARVRALEPANPPAAGALFLGESGSYWLDLAGYDPAATAAALGIPVLVLQGESDTQVTAIDFEGWKAGLAAAPNATLRLFPKLNHQFVEGEGAPAAAGRERPAHVAPEVVDAVAAWTRALPPRTSP
ncbi:MAG: alpha/beta fold hydrolase [Thermoanaerobaculia bacterium]